MEQYINFRPRRRAYRATQKTSLPDYSTTAAQIPVPITKPERLSPNRSGFFVSANVNILKTILKTPIQNGVFFAIGRGVFYTYSKQRKNHVK